MLFEGHVAWLRKNARLSRVVGLGRRNGVGGGSEELNKGRCGAVVFTIVHEEVGVRGRLGAAEAGQKARDPFNW